MIPVGGELPSRTKPLVTYGLIAVNALIFAFTYGSVRALDGGVADRWGFVPADIRPQSVLTHMFLHAGVAHVFFNMLYLFIFGGKVEEAFGRLGYIALYLATGVLAIFGHYALYPHSTMPVVGASGAISGLLGAYLFLFPRNRVRVFSFFGLYPRLFTMPAGGLLAFYFFLQIVFGVASHIAATSAGLEVAVAYWAHLAGFAGGLGITAALVASGVVVRPTAPTGPSREALDAISRMDADAGRASASYVEVSESPDGAQRQIRRLSTRVVDKCEFPADAKGRFDVISNALKSGDVFAAMAGVRLELNQCLTRPAPHTLASLADLFYNARKYPVAFELYRTAIATAGKADVRLPEMRYRAGVVAARRLKMYDAGIALLNEAARAHEDAERVRSAQRLVEETSLLLARNVAGTEGSLLAGPCVLVRRTLERIDISRVGRLVCKATGRPLAETTRMLHSSPGFVAADIEPMVAKRLAAELSEAGIPSLVIPADKLVALPAANELFQIRAAADGLECVRRGKNAEPCAVAWKRIFFASAAYVEEKREPGTLTDAAFDADAGDWPSRRSGDEPMRTQTRTETCLVLDVFTLEPFECYRCKVGSTRFMTEKRPPEEGMRDNPGRFAQAFAVFGADVPANEGVVYLALDVPAQRWRALTFDSMGEFERYNYWRLQLEQYG